MIILLIILGARCSLFTYIFPMYNFSMHDTPVVYVNDTELVEEVKYFEWMKKISVGHSIVSGVTSVALVGLAPWAVPLPLTYWAYHTYVFHYSSHLRTKCEFEISEFNDPFDKTKFSLLGCIPNYVYEPVFFVFISWFFIVIYTNFVRHKNWKMVILFLIMVIYTYSFFQILKESVDVLDITKSQKLKELKWKCHANRITFRQKMYLVWVSIIGMVTDKDGYIINKECQKLEQDLSTAGLNLASILYKTFTTPITLIIREILDSIKLRDKIFLSLLFIAITSICIKYRLSSTQYKEVTL